MKLQISNSVSEMGSQTQAGRFVQVLVTGCTVQASTWYRSGQGLGLILQDRWQQISEAGQHINGIQMLERSIRILTSHYKWEIYSR